MAEAAGDAERAFALLADARARCNRLADPYLWLDVYILDAQCQLGLRHGAVLGREGDEVAAAVLAEEIAEEIAVHR